MHTVNMSGWNFAALPLWIGSNAGNTSGAWHVGIQRITVGPKTGKILAVSQVTACNGRTLGGPYGYSKAADVTGDFVCPRCARMFGL